MGVVFFSYLKNAKSIFMALAHRSHKNRSGFRRSKISDQPMFLKKGIIRDNELKAMISIERMYFHA